MNSNDYTIEASSHKHKPPIIQHLSATCLKINLNYLQTCCQSLQELTHPIHEEGPWHLTQIRLFTCRHKLISMLVNFIWYRVDSKPVGTCTSLSTGSQKAPTHSCWHCLGWHRPTQDWHGTGWPGMRLIQNGTRLVWTGMGFVHNNIYRNSFFSFFHFFSLSWTSKWKGQLSLYQYGIQIHMFVNMDIDTYRQSYYGGEQYKTGDQHHGGVISMTVEELFSNLGLISIWFPLLSTKKSRWVWVSLKLNVVLKNWMLWFVVCYFKIVRFKSVMILTLAKGLMTNWPLH